MLQVNMPDLSQLMGGMGGYAMGQQKDMAYQNNKINQDQALQDTLFAEQKQPLTLDRLGLENDTTRAQLPGVEADSWTRQRNMEQRKGVPIDLEQRAAISKIAASMSDDDWKQQENALNQGLISKNPQERAQAQKMLPLLKEFQMEAMKNKDRMERESSLEAQRQSGRMALATTNNAAKVNNRAQGNAMEKALLAGNYIAVANAYDLKAQQTEDKEEQAFFLSKAQEYRQLQADKDAARARAASEGKIDAGAATNLPTRPVTPPVALPLVRGASAPNGATADRPKRQEEMETFKKAFGSYDPNQYEYRIGPNGVPQRKKKQ